MVRGLSTVADHDWIECIFNSVKKQTKVSNRGNVARRHNLSKTTQTFPCTYNETMKLVWENIWARLTPALLNNSKKDLVQHCLTQYTLLQVSDNHDVADSLLPVNYAYVAMYVDQMAASQSRQLQAGHVNERAVQINDHFNRVLSERHIEMPTGRPLDLIVISAKGPINQEARLLDDYVVVCEPLQSQSGRLEKQQLEERKARAAANVKAQGLSVPLVLPKRTRCVVCLLQRDTRHLMKSNKVIFCPLADPPEEGKKEKQRRRDHRQHKKKRTRIG